MKLTLGGLAYRALWEIDGRSGFKALRTPRGQVPIPASVPDFDSWYNELGAAHVLRRPASRSSAPDLPDVRLPDWHLEPATGQRWPGRVHWTRARLAGAGDLRLTWERNRFAHVWRWLADGTDAAEEFREQLGDWRHENPFRSGVNWASGQEIALRALAWTRGAAAYGATFDPSEWQDLVELLYWHGVQIEAEWGFASRAVRNNHVLAEALGLAVIGDAFPGFDEADRWRGRGLKAIEAAVADQFFDDGGYCQCSHAYHHFALELLLIADAWFPELQRTLHPVFVRSAKYLAAIIEDGGVPNFGPNDRMDHPDFERLLASLREASGDAAIPLTDSPSFPTAGLHLLRHDGATATLRCGELPDRAGHDDGLHLEVWLGGKPVAIDAGSFRYGGVEHDWFTAARSHNVCSAGSTAPRELLSTFTWDRIAHPVLHEHDPHGHVMTASYGAFAGTRWERHVTLHDGGAVEVNDLLDPLSGSRVQLMRLHWLINAKPRDVRVESVGSFTWNIFTPQATIVVSATPVMGRLERTRLLSEHGWSSRRYGQREMVTSLTLTTLTPAVRFKTRFSPA